MKKIILSAMLLSVMQFTFANPILTSTSTIQVPVPNGGTVAPMGGVLVIPIGGVLINRIVYNVTCHISNPNTPEPVTVKLSTENTYCPTLGGCGGYIVNGKYPASNQVNLTEADNIVTYIKAMGTAYDKSAVDVTNLDTTATVTVSHCEAVPAT